MSALLAPHAVTWRVAMVAEVVQENPQAVTLVLRTDKDLEPTQNLRLQALSPQLRWVVDVQLVRAAPNAWRGVFRFKSKGTWRLIVPNWGAPGSASPIPLDRRVTVLPKRR